ncbi:NlpC/P60 family protein [Streptosporangium sp. NPDC000396]|uniref:bifunctional WXG100 family type VII secretion target/C40 family peptidase n=1 Tax=Streptosporangium sp. NPDC000396 TaxID=3366185 RepID=UPI00368C6096
MTDKWDDYLRPIQNAIDELTGDQAEVSKISTRWRGVATNIPTHTGTLKRAVTTVNDAWNGSAAESFAGYMAKYTEQGTALNSALTNCASKLDAAGTALEAAKGEAQAIYNRTRTWLDEQRKDSDSTTISMTSIRSKVDKALAELNKPEGAKQRAIKAIEEATSAIDELDKVKFFSSIPAPADQDFYPKNNLAMRWTPDPGFDPRGTTQLASYKGGNGLDLQTGGNGYGSGSESSGNGYGSGGSGGGSPNPGLEVPPNARSLAANPRAQAIVDFALNHRGDRYIWGATGPNAFDCSGLTLRAYEAAGIEIPRVAHDQWLHGPRIPDGKEQAGDLIFFDKDGDGVADHVGIVLDPEKKTMIHAPNSHSVVRIESYGDYPTPRLGFTRPGMG